MNNHADFITSPIADILKDVVSASAGISNGIETYPLCDYIMQSAFLKMTGFQEQKMKCICWEIATNDYEYRSKRYSYGKIGECSNYEDKNKVFNDLCEQLINHFPDFDISAEINKIDIISDSILEINVIFQDTNLLVWAQSSFNEYGTISKNFGEKNFLKGDKNLFNDSKNNDSLKKIYNDYLYRHRNRCAHNLLSYQQNLPTLKKLMSESYRYENYFVWFVLLVLIDKIFIKLYNNYLQTLE